MEPHSIINPTQGLSRQRVASCWWGSTQDHTDHLSPVWVISIAAFITFITAGMKHCACLCKALTGLGWFNIFHSAERACTDLITHESLWLISWLPAAYTPILWLILLLTCHTLHMKHIMHEHMQVHTHLLSQCWCFHHYSRYWSLIAAVISAVTFSTTTAASAMIAILGPIHIECNRW